MTKIQKFKSDRHPRGLNPRLQGKKPCAQPTKLDDPYWDKLRRKPGQALNNTIGKVDKTLFIFITIFCGTDSIMQNISHNQIPPIPYNIVMDLNNVMDAQNKIKVGRPRWGHPHATTRQNPTTLILIKGPSKGPPSLILSNKVVTKLVDNI